MSSEDPFGGLFGDPDELRRRMAEFAEQMQGAQRVAWADNAIKLAVDMTVAGLQRMNLQGNAEQQSRDLLQAMRLMFPEAVILVREAREGFDNGRPVGVITDRDLALAVVADQVDAADVAGTHASRPLVTGEVEMDIEEAVALMIQHRIRRLPVTEGEALVGIVTIDDLAVRAGDLHQAQQITAEVARAALPEFYFHQRGG